MIGDRSTAAIGSRYWNRQGLRFARSFYGSPTTAFYRAEEQRLFHTYFGDLRGKRLLKLDLWNEAQNTEILFWSAEAGAQSFGVDIAEETVRKAQVRGRGQPSPIHVAVADISQLPFPDSAFDLLYTMGTIEHLLDPSAALAEATRVLAPGGVAIVGVPNLCDPFLFAAASTALQMVGKYPYGYERWYTHRQLAALLREQGLRVEHRDGILLLPWFLRMLDMWLWLQAPPLCAATELLLRPFELLAQRPGLVRRFGYLTVCVARKPGCAPA
jgi:SAM-dependent methyltransferase